MLTRRDLRLPPTLPARIALILLSVFLVPPSVALARYFFQVGNPLSGLISVVLALFLSSAAVTLRTRGWEEPRADFVPQFTRPGSPSPATKTESEPGDDD